MIRKAIIVVFVSMAIGAAALAVLAYVTPHSTRAYGKGSTLRLTVMDGWYALVTFGQFGDSHLYFGAARGELSLGLSYKVDSATPLRKRQFSLGAFGFYREVRRHRGKCGVGTQHIVNELSDEERIRWRLPTASYRISSPAWIPFILSAAYPASAFARGPVRRSRRRKRGFCLKCRYDLRANESGVCPECGTRIEQT